MTDRLATAPIADADAEHARNIVKTYYGETLSRSEDLRTNACKIADAPDAAMRGLLSNLHEDTLARFFGCGLIAPPALQGARVLDLGCGAGRDVYVLAQMVGPEGHVAGVDMTPEQLAVARAHEEWHRERFGYAETNTAFHQGLLEQLEDLPLAPASFDVAVSNCVINLVADKAAALKGVRRLLKPGGEFYFSDVYADRRVSEDVRQDPMLYGECLGGALYWRDFLAIAREAGFAAPRLLSAAPIEASDPAVAAKLGETRFVSATYRLFALEGADAEPEDYGDAARYLGGIADAPDVFQLDAALTLKAGDTIAIDRGAALAFEQSRLAPFFEVTRGGSHRGPFMQDPAPSPFTIATGAASAGCCG